MRFAALLAILPIGIITCAVEAAEPYSDALDGAPIGVVVGATGLATYVDPVRATPAPHTLAPGSRVEVIATGTVAVREDASASMMAPRHLVRRPGSKATFWVDGGRLAIASQSAGTQEPTDLFRHHAMAYTPADFDGDGVDDSVFMGVVRELEVEDDEPGHLHAELVVAMDGGAPLSLQLFSDWGTGAHLQKARTVDLDGDGQEEWVLAWDSFVTEVGNGGLVVQHVGLNAAGELSILGEMQLQNPRRNGLLQRRFGASTLTGSGISQLGVDVVPCEAIARGACLQGWRTYTHQAVRHPREAEHTPTPLSGFVIDEAEQRVGIVGFKRAADEGPADALLIERDGEQSWVPPASIRWEQAALEVALFGSDAAVERVDWLAPM